MGAASCFGSSSTVVIWVPLLFTQAYTVQASIWWRRMWISNTKMQKLFNSATYLDFSFHQDFSSFLLNRLRTARKIPQLWDKYIYQRYTVPYHISPLYFQKKRVHTAIWYLPLFSIKLSSTVCKWICLYFVNRIAYITLKKMSRCNKIGNTISHSTLILVHE